MSKGSFHRPNLQIGNAGDYPLKIGGYWARWDSEYLYLRGHPAVAVNDSLTYKTIIFTVQNIEWLDTGELRLTVIPAPAPALGGYFGGL